MEANKLELKVKRGELAKEFPMLHIEKCGDVGLDVPVALPYVDGWQDAVDDYMNYLNGAKPDEKHINFLKHGCITINPGERYLLPTDIRLEIPDGYWIAVEARSSTSKKLIIVPKGVIDTGYRGEIFAQAINIGKEPVQIHHGDRIVQLIMRKNYTKDLIITEVDELSPSERGETGFGSSGESAIIK